MYSRSIRQLIEALTRLPSVGERTAGRYVFHLLKSGKGEVNALRAALDELLRNTKSCALCHNFADTIPCPICANAARDNAQICVVANPQDVEAIEKTGEYRGVYHVLRGTLDADDVKSIAATKINELFKRVQSISKGPTPREVILALNPDLAGETTAMYLARSIAKLNPKIKVTRLARGLPMGSDLQYADEITLASALKNRR